MLRHLSITNVAVIETLELDFTTGLTVLTGETGAGKSILIDALGLTLGRKADQTMVREGAAEARVAAEFDISAIPELMSLLKDQGFGDDVNLVVRRVLNRDGRSRVWINDTPTGMKMLRSIGGQLLEIIGQYAQMDLFDDDEPQDILDDYSKADEVCRQLAACYKTLSHHRQALQEEKNLMARREEARHYLQVCVSDFEELDYSARELEAVSRQRMQLQAVDRLHSVVRVMDDALKESPAPLDRIRHARRELQPLATEVDDEGQKTLRALEKAEEELIEALAYFDSWSDRLVADPQSLERIDERFFAIKAICRKYDCEAEDLPQALEDARKKMLNLDEGDARMNALNQLVVECEQEFTKRIYHLHDARQSAAFMLTKALQEELPPLRLEKAQFAIEVELKPPDGWNDKGGDRIRFFFSANPGLALKPLTKVASGGEMSRFLLSLKLVLADSFNRRGFVFDEIDMAVGGATAAAIGKRLKRLSRSHQVLVITHSPQVAAFGDQHLRIAKRVDGGRTITTVVDISDPQHRREEIARMLAGHSVTDAARRAAESLLSSA